VPDAVMTPFSSSTDPTRTVTSRREVGR
jgi:hypothetical protein